MAVHRIMLTLCCVWVLGWACVGVTLAQTSSLPNGDVHLTPGAVATMLGIVAIVGPGFYAAGRLNQRVTEVERQIQTLVMKGVEVGERIATAVEKLADIAPPSGGSDPRNRRH